LKSSLETSEPPRIEPEVLIAAARQRLIEKMAVDETRLRRLAQERAIRIKDHLIRKGKIPSERVVMVEVKIDHSSDADTMVTCEAVLKPDLSRFSAAKIFFPAVRAMSFSALFWFKVNEFHM